MKSAFLQIVLTAVVTSLIVVLVQHAIGNGEGLSLPVPSPATSSQSAPSKEFLTPVIFATLGGLLLALLVFLLPDRWRRLEAEILNLRQAQDKALDDLRKRADDRIVEKLDGASRQAQGILDHVTSLAERFPWIRGVSEVGFAPNSNACQIVLRNSARLVATGQGMLAHDYLYSWTKSESAKPRLEGSSSDFLQMAAFAQLVLADEYLATELISVGYRSRARQAFLAAPYLRALSRNGMIPESIDVAEAIRRRALPTWRERSREVWYAIRRLGTPTVRGLRATPDDCAALAIFFSVVGDQAEFDRASSRASKLCVTTRERLIVMLGKAEGLAALGFLESAIELVRSVPAQEAATEGLAFEFVWTLRRCALNQEASDLLASVSKQARVFVQLDFGAYEDSADTPVSPPPPVQSVPSGVNADAQEADLPLRPSPPLNTSPEASRGQNRS